jgi:RNA polymerase sigma-70 factor (ECF subfamily)
MAQGVRRLPELISRSSGAVAAQVANDVRPTTLDAFLAGIERRALRMAEIATRDRDEALDIVQDAMMNLARHYSQKPCAEWPPLFYRILDNRIRDWQRRQTVKHRIFFWNDKPLNEDEREDLVERAPDPAPPVEGKLAQQQAMEKLEHAVGHLPGRQREAFMLRIWEGLSVEQTARVMGCSGGSVKTHLSRALAALRLRLKGIWP